MAVTRVSTAATFQNTIRDFTGLQAESARISEQISSGKKASTFIELNSDIRQVLDFESSIRTIGGFVDSNNIVVSRLGVMDNSVSQIYEILVDMKQNIIAEGTNPNQIDLTSLARSALEQAASNLDVQQSGRYLFAGSKITTPPSGNIINVSNIDTSGNVDATYYQGDGLKFTINANDQLNVEYGITGDNVAFQNAFAALHSAVAADDTGGASSVQLQNAQDLIDVALDQILSLRSQIGTDSGILEGANNQHERVKVQIEGQLSDIISTDIAEATIRQSLNQTTLQATLQSFVRLSELKLSDFLR